MCFQAERLLETVAVSLKFQTIVLIETFKLQYSFMIVSNFNLNLRHALHYIFYFSQRTRL